MTRPRDPATRTGQDDVIEDNRRRVTRNHSIGVAIPTYRARAHLAHCLPPLRESPLRPRILVVDSSSGDGTVEEAERLGAETLVIPRNEFNHGATRELARRRLGTEIAVMVTAWSGVKPAITAYR